MHLITSKTLANRRHFLRQLAATGAFLTTSGLYAEALTLTPGLTQGPFYPLAKNIPLDKDNDLVLMNDSLTPAKGIITHVGGRVLDSQGDPIRDALIELWHCDDAGEYTFDQNAPRNASADPNFAGFGQFLTGKTGEYRFRTIKAGLYHGRTRHFHFGITIPGQKTRYTTQLFWNETARGTDGKVWDSTNDNDGVLRGIRDAAQRASVIRDFTKVSGSTVGEEQTTWDIVMGLTPMEQPYPGGGADGGHLVVAAAEMPPVNGKARFKVTVPAYAGYSYEIYANPTMGNLGWAALPFTLGATMKLDCNIHTATAEGALDFYVERPSVKGFYYVAFRVPGANTGTPGNGAEGGFGGPGGPGGPRRARGARGGGDFPPPR
jgi:protocatechuate 3,4-dioxygenase beta subunit